MNSRNPTLRGTIAQYLVILTGISLLWVIPELRAQQPDLILHNGKILTVDKNFSTMQAVAVSGDHFQAVGSDQDILKLAGPNTQVIDLKGRTVVPGLIDTHSHIDSYAEGAYGGEIGAEKLRRFNVDWAGVKTKEDVLNQIQGLMQRYKPKPGEWLYFNNSVNLVGRDGNVNNAKILWDELTRWELDKVTPDNPIGMTNGYPTPGGFRVNSQAIDIIWNKMGDADFIKKYGRFSVASNGQPDGLLEPPASRIVGDALGGGAPADLGPIFREFIQEINAQGITAVSARMPDYTVKTYQWLESRKELPIRIGYGQMDAFGSIKGEDLAKDLPILAKQVGTGSDLLWMTSVSVAAVDGTTGQARVCTNLPRVPDAAGPLGAWYPMGACQMDTEYRGPAQRAAPLQGNYFRDWINDSARYGARFANTHVAGDRSYSMLITMMDQLQKQYGPNAIKNWALDHCTMVNPADLPLAGKLGLTFSCNPKYVQDARAVARDYGEKIANTYVVPVKSMLNAGAKVVFEMDGDSNVWGVLEGFVTRKDDSGKVWGPQEKLDRTTALQTITRWAAGYVLKPDKLGSIEPGKLADLVILNRDYMTIPEEEIKTIRAQMTMLGGKVIYVHPDFAQEYNFHPADAVVATYETLKARRKPFRGAGSPG